VLYYNCFKGLSAVKNLPFYFFFLVYLIDVLLKNSIKLKIQLAVTIALISSGIIPAVNAAVYNANVNNPQGTTINIVNMEAAAVTFIGGGTYTVNNAGIISSVSDGASIAIGNQSSTIINLTNSGTISAIGGSVAAAGIFFGMIPL